MSHAYFFKMPTRKQKLINSEGKKLFNKTYLTSFRNNRVYRKGFKAKEIE